MDLRIVTGGPDLEEVRVLFGEYSQQAGAELCFEGLERWLFPPHLRQQNF